MFNIDSGLTEEAKDLIIRAALRTGTKSEAELAFLTNWCHKALVNAGIVKAIVDGYVDVHISGTASADREIAFSINPKGEVHLEDDTRPTS